MNYNPKIHNRKSIRLKGYDYSSNGIYFITINCQDKIHRFGNIEGAGLASAHIKLSNYGVIADEQWQKLPLRFPNIELGAMQIMPDHVHGIIIIKNQENLAAPNSLGAKASPARTNGLGDIISAYKSIVANECLKIAKSKNEMLGKFWQRNYYERILRNENAYELVSRYIVNNPQKWKEK